MSNPALLAAAVSLEKKAEASRAAAIQLLEDGSTAQSLISGQIESARFTIFKEVAASLREAAEANSAA